MIYKLAFMSMGVWPFDRLFQLVDPTRPFLCRCLAEPALGWWFFKRFNFVMIVPVKIFVFVRYTLMPNMILVMLASMKRIPGCTNYVYYAYDRFWSRAVYVVVIVDLFFTVILLAAQHALYPILSRWTKLYTLLSIHHLFWWFSTSWIPAIFGIIYAVRTGSLPNLWGINFNIVFEIDTDMHWSVELFQLLLGAETMASFWQLLHAILGTILPVVCAKYCGYDATWFAYRRDGGTLVGQVKSGLANLWGGGTLAQSGIPGDHQPVV